MKTVIVIMILVVWTAGEGRAQDQRKIDSLKSRLTGTTDQKSYPLLWGLAYELYDVNNPEAVFYARRAHEVALQMGDSLQIVKSGRILGQLLRRTDQILMSIGYLTNVLSIAERNDFRQEVKFILNTLCLSYSETPFTEIALEYSVRSLRLRQEDGDPREIGTALNNVGLLYNYLELDQIALEYYLRALVASEDGNDEVLRALVLGNLSTVYINLNDTTNAKRCVEKAYYSCSPNCRDEVKSMLEYVRGVILLKGGKYQLAKDHFEAYLNLDWSKASSDNLRIKRLSQCALLEVYLRLGKPKLAQNVVANLNYALSQTGYIDPHIFSTLASYYTHIGKYKESVTYLMKANNVRGNRFKDKTIRGISTLENYFAQKANMDQIRSQQKMLDLQEERIDLRNKLFTVASIMIILAIAAFILLIKYLREKDSINKILDKRVRERTEELENSHSQVVHSHNEQMVILKQIHSMIVALLSTWRGLSNLAEMEESNMSGHYRNAVKNIEQVRDVVAIYLNSKKSYNHDQG